jgi:hypothetical protein
MVVAGPRDAPNAYMLENKAPAAQLNGAGAVRSLPPLTEDSVPLARLKRPPLTEAKSLLTSFDTPFTRPLPRGR